MNPTSVTYPPGNNQYPKLMEEAEQVAHFGGWEVNLITGEVKWSLKMYQILGFDPLTTAATFGNFIRIVHKDDVLYIKSNLEKLLKSPSDDVYYFRIINQADHTIKYLRTGIVANRDHNGMAVNLTGFSQDITQHILAEKKLENINKELNTFFNIIDDVFFSIDVTSGKVIQVSQAFEKMFGYPRQALFDDFNLIEKLYNPEDKDSLINAFTKIKKGETTTAQLRILKKDNTVTWAECKVIPGLNPDGELVRLDGVIGDITARKNAELKLQRSEYRFRQLIESAQEGIWTLDENNLTNFVNKKMCEILEYSPDEMIGKDLLHFVDKSDHADTLASMERRRNGAKESLNIRYVTKNGKYVWTNINTNPIFDENGVYRGALAMVTDITEQLNAEQSLKESEANLRTVFENTELGFVLFNFHFNIISFNHQADSYCSLHFNKRLKAGISGTIFIPDGKKDLIENILQSVKSGENISYDVSYYLTDSKVKWYNIKWAGIFDDTLQRIGVLFTIKDITEQKLLELEREKIMTDLMARNKDQEQFNYMVSHSLRAPVANISGLVQLLTDPDLSEADKLHIINCLSESVKTVDLVINDMNEVLELKTR
jgi:PAS domain S-box-containing protein